MAHVTRVLLIHGLWMPSASMRPLAARLRRAGYDTTTIDYSSVRGGPPQATDHLAEAALEGPCHIVAHSLGGLIALAALERRKKLPVARVACLGSPLCGSDAARGIARLPVVGASLGRSEPLLVRGCRPWRGEVQIGMVAGNRPLGLGQVFAGFDGPSDGTVAVAETQLPGLRDHVVVPASHMGLLISEVAARQAIAFLRHGRFERAVG